jgi:hypothetical protein
VLTLSIRARTSLKGVFTLISGKDKQNGYYKNNSYFMAIKRMFSQNIIGSDAFMDMPIGSQLLYFHLGMEADDDGFIGNPKKVMRGIGCKDDDLKVLLSKRFVLMFESGVLVIKHHRVNNNWDSYNCKRTIYLEEFSKLYIKQNKGYTFDEKQGISAQSEISLKSDVKKSLEENRIDKKRIEENTNTIQFFLFNKNTQREENTKYFSTSVEANQWAVRNMKKLGEDYFALEVRQK